MIRIVAPHFVAGVVLKDERVIYAAPILKWMAGWTVDRVEGYCRSKGWEFQRS